MASKKSFLLISSILMLFVLTVDLVLTECNSFGKLPTGSLPKEMKDIRKEIS